LASKRNLYVAAGVAVAILVVALPFLFVRNNQDRREVFNGEILVNTEDPAVWGKYYPAHYDSYMKNYQNTEKPDHYIDIPYMKVAWAGTGFANEFNEPRGHVYTLEDIRAIHPSRYKKGAACNTCKSAQIPGVIAELGDSYYLKGFEEVNSQLTQPIACLNCHDPKTMELKITQPALIEAYARQGKDVNDATRQEMRSLVCGQCHVTYYFEAETNKVTFPWDKGLDPEQVLSYYEAEKFTEWKYPGTDSPLLKARHAEYEVFMGSTHQTAGVACADCHMPYTKEGNIKISSHNWVSPLETIEESCTPCHREGTDWLKNQVETTQAKTKEIQDIAGAALLETIEALKTATATPGADLALLNQARQLHRQGQWYLDWVVVTNGWGFHNPEESIATLGKAIDLCHRATQLAKDAVKPQT